MFKPGDLVKFKELKEVYMLAYFDEYSGRYVLRNVLNEYLSANINEIVLAG